MKSVHADQKGSQEWINCMVEMTAYLVNPSIGEKHETLCDELTSNYLPALATNQEWFQDVLISIQKHQRECYELLEVNKDENVLNGDLAKPHEFFERQVAIIE